MAPVFSPDIIARVKDETDIVEIVRGQVSLKAAGAVYKGLCPFHKEKTPSFIVTPARGRYHCFGCGAGGDVISFLMETEGITFPEAVEILARPLDIDLSDWLREDENEGERRAFFRANGVAADVWKEALWEDASGRQARTYLTDRGFSEKVLREFSVGWAPASSSWLQRKLAATGVDQDLAQQADLMRTGNGGELFAYFRSRVIFPIKSISRQVTGFGGRVLGDGEPKYLNSADSPFFSKGNLLYGFDYSRMAVAREKAAILVEGYLDLMALVQAGFNNVVATCGTAFTPGQARLIRRGAPAVYLLFDGDKAGRKAAVRSADIALREGLEPRIASLPLGQDPADVVMAAGREGIAEVLKDAPGYVEYLRRLAEPKWDDRTVKERAVKQILATVGGISDPLRREYVLQETAEIFGLEIDLLRSMVEAAAAAEPQGFVRPAPQADSTGKNKDAGGKLALEAPTRRARTRVKPLARINATGIEADLFAHILMDASGRAAAAFLEAQGDLEFASPCAGTLAGEIAEWKAAHHEGGGGSLREFVLQRWNMVGDNDYRAFVTGLLDRPEPPANTDFAQVARDCLQRLQRARRQPALRANLTETSGVGPEDG